MDLVGGAIRFSASDLVGHLACRHLTALNLEVVRGQRGAPKAWDPELKLLRERGLAHERDFIRRLEEMGREVTTIAGVGIDAETVAATVAAMRAGQDTIVQGALAEGNWGGRPDILSRIDASSDLGDWSYEVIDTKLAQETKGGTILQLSLYSDLVRTVQGVMPENMHVVVPWSEFEPQSYRCNDYAAYYRLVRSDLEAAAESHSLTYPEPREHCSICRWNQELCDPRRRNDDHLCLVAGISSSQIEELRSQDVTTTEGLAELALPLAWRPERGAAAGYERVREQARVQLEERRSGQPVWEPLAPEPKAGLALLPEPAPGDIFFDFEGSPFVGEKGLEYLFGYLTLDEAGEGKHTCLWAFDHAQEKINFEEFVDWVMARWRQYPGMHIYHFAPYEPSAMKRLMGYYATREDEVDSMLRAGLFVDLHRVVRGGLRASVESYSLKEMEKFFGFRRAADLRTVNPALFRLGACLELGSPEDIAAADRRVVEAYNRDDCASTLHLRDWLESIRQEMVRGGAEIERPAVEDGDAPESVSDWQKMIEELSGRIIGSDMPVLAGERGKEQQARWLLANVLDWHRREEKPVWWEYFRLYDYTVEELIDEKAALADLTFAGEGEDEEGKPVLRYHFPAQDVDLRGGETLYVPGVGRFGKLVVLNERDRTVDVRKPRGVVDIQPEALFAHDHIATKAQKEALVRIGEEIAIRGISGDGAFAVARDLLLREPPRTGGEPLRHEGETALDAALRIAGRPGFGVLPIQGPPGAGKTFTASRMICRLVANGARVGICANSHKVIGNLLDGVMEAAQEGGVELRAVQKVGRGASTESGDPRLILVKDNTPFFRALGRDCRVGAGTAWLWAREEAGGAVDVLFVDEAAQMSLANVLAISHAGRNLVLLGDPQQLDQPMQGSHPEGAEQSGLGHLLSGDRTIGAGRGLFLEDTWRLHPDICAFTSEMFYEDKLRSRPDLGKQCLIAPVPIGGTGLRFMPVLHQGNVNASGQEAARVQDLVHSLIAEHAEWIDRAGQRKPITLDDILIIAPYNAQVFEIQRLLPGARVGTVDKFQGQEAPVVIYSMATSTPEEAPRGMEFLYSLNRLNVATSRARCVCVLVASPALFTPACRSPRQMQLANAFCRYRELAVEISM
ncbi:MAG: TM0106 family RecB-like putative nuclease [Caldilineaceae bacterium]|nr:TM0106 family RecB-like putative nuclease [Caldilineaceae bacterium]